MRIQGIGRIILHGLDGRVTFWESDSFSVRTMEPLELTDNWDDVALEVREMETNNLLQLYDMMVKNPTPFQIVSNELLYRGRTEENLEHNNQVSEIRKRF